MREILFRGFYVNGRGKETAFVNGLKYKGKWLYGTLVISRGVSYINVKNKKLEVIHETVGQYTGLTDKNGTKIFEKDIVYTEYAIKHVGLDKQEICTSVVIFLEGCFMKLPIGQDIGIYHFSPSDKEEVLCNIHDNHDFIGE